MCDILVISKNKTNISDLEPNSSFASNIPGHPHPPPVSAAQNRSNTAASKVRSGPASQNISKRKKIIELLRKLFQINYILYSHCFNSLFIQQTNFPSVYNCEFFSKEFLVDCLFSIRSIDRNNLMINKENLVKFLNTQKIFFIANDSLKFSLSQLPSNSNVDNDYWKSDASKYLLETEDFNQFICNDEFHALNELLVHLVQTAVTQYRRFTNKTDTLDGTGLENIDELNTGFDWEYPIEIDNDDTKFFNLIFLVLKILSKLQKETLKLYQKIAEENDFLIQSNGLILQNNKFKINWYTGLKITFATIPIITGVGSLFVSIISLRQKCN